MLALVPPGERQGASAASRRVCQKWALIKLDAAAERIQTLTLGHALGRWRSFARYVAARQHALLFSRTKACAVLAGTVQRWALAMLRRGLDAWWMASQRIHKRCVQTPIHSPWSQ
jgi:hypothetical protein